MLSRRDFLIWLGGLGTVTVLGQHLHSQLQTLEKSIIKEPESSGKKLLTISTASLVFNSKRDGFEAVISLLGLENRGGNSHFHAFMFNQAGKLVAVESSRLDQLQNKVIQPPDEKWLSVLVAIEAPESHLLATNPESSAVIHHRTPWGEDGHHFGQWEASQGGIGLTPAGGNAASLIGAANLSDRAATGHLKVTNQFGKIVYQDEKFEFPAFGTRYFHIGEATIRPNASLKLPKSDLTDVYLFEFLSEHKSTTITWNSWRTSPKSFTAFHGTHSNTNDTSIQEPKPIRDIGEDAHDFMKRHWLYPADMIPFGKLPDGTKVSTQIYIPNLSQLTIRPQIFLASNKAKIVGKLKTIREIPKGGSLSVEVSAKDFIFSQDPGDFGYALVHFGIRYPASAIGKVLTTSESTEASFMQHFRPLELLRTESLQPITTVINKDVLTDYFIATPTNSYTHLLIRNYSDTACQDAILTTEKDGRHLVTYQIPKIAPGELVAIEKDKLGSDSHLRGIRLVSQNHSLKINALQKSDLGFFSVTHGTHRIKIFAIPDLDSTITSRLAATSET